MIKLVCWNIAKNHDPWRCLVNNEHKVDIALLQEAGRPPINVREPLEVDPAPFHDSKTDKGLSRCAIVKLSDRVAVEFLSPIPLNWA